MMFRFRRKKKVSDPLAVVQRFVDAANRHDAQGVADCLHRDFDSVQPIYPSRSFRGSEQVRRNWQAIFKSEPGFRLTLLRSASSDDTVWVELHGAGREAEVAGVFIMGVENNLVRWARVYSAVVDQEFEGPADAGEQGAAVAVDDGVSDARAAAELREMVDAGRVRAAAGRREGATADDGALTPEPAPQAATEDDSLGTGEHPLAVVDAASEAALDEPTIGAETLVEPVPDEAGPQEPAAEPVGEAVAAAVAEVVEELVHEGPVEVSLDDLLGEGPAPDPGGPDVDPVIDLVTPAGSDDEPGGERRFGPSLRRP